MFILKYFILASTVVCMKISKSVDYTARTHNTSDSSENTTQSIYFFITPYETAIITAVMFENILL
jgi:hypothetical protein